MAASLIVFLTGRFRFVTGNVFTYVASVPGLPRGAFVALRVRDPC